MTGMNKYAASLRFLALLILPFHTPKYQWILFVSKLRVTQFALGSPKTTRGQLLMSVNKSIIDVCPGLLLVLVDVFVSKIPVEGFCSESRAKIAIDQA